MLIQQRRCLPASAASLLSNTRMLALVTVAFGATISSFAGTANGAANNAIKNGSAPQRISRHQLRLTDLSETWTI